MSSEQSYRDRLKAIYEVHAPAEAHQVDALLRKYQGREEALIAAATQKYGASPPVEGRPPPPPSSSVVSTTAPTPITHFHDRLRRIYEAYTPKRVPFAARDLAKYPGREEDVIRAAVKKYGPEPDTSPEPEDAQSATPEGTGGGSPPETAKTRAESLASPDYRARITALYTKYAPQRLPRVEHELVKYKGREEALIHAIEAKYVCDAAQGTGTASHETTEAHSGERGDLPPVPSVEAPATVPSAAAASPPWTDTARESAAATEEQQPHASEGAPARKAVDVADAETGPKDDASHRPVSPDAATPQRRDAESATESAPVATAAKATTASAQSRTASSRGGDSEGSDQAVRSPGRPGDDQPLFTLSPVIEEEPAGAGVPTPARADSRGETCADTGAAPSAAQEAACVAEETGDGRRDATEANRSVSHLKDGQWSRGEAEMPSAAMLRPRDPLHEAAGDATPLAVLDRGDASGGGGVAAKATFHFPAALLHDVFHSLGTTRLSGVDMTTRTTALALLQLAFGINMTKARGGSEGAAGTRSGEVLWVEATNLGGEFVTEGQFAAFLHSYGAAHYWRDREAAYHIRRAEAYLKRCQGALVAAADASAAATSRERAGNVPRVGLPECAEPSDDMRELRSGFWLHCCIFPCAVPAWKRCWAFAALAKATTPTSGTAAAGTVSRISICHRGSAKVDLSIPFEKVQSCFLESMLARDSVAAGGTAPPTAFARNGLVLRLADGANPLEVRLCCEKMRLTHGILKAYQRWRAAKTAAGGSDAASRTLQGSARKDTPAASRHERSSLYSPADMTAIASDPVLRELAWTRLWVCQMREGACADGGDGALGTTPQLCAWAFYGGRLLHAKLSKTRDGTRHSSSAVSPSQVHSWDVGAAEATVTAVDHLPMRPPGQRKVYYPFVMNEWHSGRRTYVWASARAERGALIGQLRRLQLRHRVFREAELPVDASTCDDAERALSFSPESPWPSKTAPQEQ